MQFKHLASFALAATLASGAAGCVVRAHGFVSAPEPVAVVEVDEEPPAPRVWVTETRPGFVFVQGNWYRAGGRWEWRNGYWERERPGQQWEQGRWERRGNRHVYVQGGWHGGGHAAPATRDHRRNDPPPPPRNDGPVIRDHRH